MSLESSSHLPGGFQVRHCSLGIYQGSAIELAFWHPSSGMPEYGLCRFSTETKAQALFEPGMACASPSRVDWVPSPSHRRSAQVAGVGRPRENLASE